MFDWISALKQAKQELLDKAEEKEKKKFEKKGAKKVDDFEILQKVIFSPGKGTPVPPNPQYPSGCLTKYC